MFGKYNIIKKKIYIDICHCGDKRHNNQFIQDDKSKSRWNSIHRTTKQCLNMLLKLKKTKINKIIIFSHQ